MPGEGHERKSFLKDFGAALTGLAAVITAVVALMTTLSPKQPGSPRPNPGVR